MTWENWVEKFITELEDLEKLETGKTGNKVDIEIENSFSNIICRDSVLVACAHLQFRADQEGKSKQHNIVTVSQDQIKTMINDLLWEPNPNSLFPEFDEVYKISTIRNRVLSESIIKRNLDLLCKPNQNGLNFLLQKDEEANYQLCSSDSWKFEAVHLKLAYTWLHYIYKCTKNRYPKKHFRMWWLDICLKIIDNLLSKPGLTQQNLMDQLGEKYRVRNVLMLLKLAGIVKPELNLFLTQTGQNLAQCFQALSLSPFFSILSSLRKGLGLLKFELLRGIELPLQIRQITGQTECSEEEWRKLDRMTRALFSHFANNEELTMKDLDSLSQEQMDSRIAAQAKIGLIQVVEFFLQKAVLKINEENFSYFLNSEYPLDLQKLLQLWESPKTVLTVTPKPKHIENANREIIRIALSYNPSLLSSVVKYYCQQIEEPTINRRDVLPRSLALLATLPDSLQGVDSLIHRTSEDEEVRSDLFSLPEPLLNTEDDPKAQIWLDNFEKTLKMLQEHGLETWLEQRLKNLGIGVRGLKDFGLIDAVLFVPPLHEMVSPLQEALKTRGVVGLFGRSGSGKSKLSIYLAHWWTTIEYQAPIYYVKDPSTLTEEDCNEIICALTSPDQNSVPLLILEDLHNVGKDTYHRIVKYFISPISSPSSPQNWVVIGSYTLPPEKEYLRQPEEMQEAWYESFRREGRYCTLDEHWSAWHVYFYPWLDKVAKVLKRTIPDKGVLSKCATPWHYLVALGFLDEEFQALRGKEYGETDELLYGFLAWGYLCTREHGLPLKTVIALLRQQTTIRKQFEEAIVVYKKTTIAEKSQGDELIEIDLKKKYKQHWDVYVEKRIEEWQRPAGEHLRLLPSLGSEGQIEFFHAHWAEKVLTKLLQADIKVSLNELIASALPSLKEVFDALKPQLFAQETFIEWTSSHVYNLALSPEKNKVTAKELVLVGVGLSSLPESFGQLTSLTHLNLASNQLVSLPESFGQLTKLQTLDLSSNKLSSLPESFGQLTKLNWLLLKKNQLQELPSSFIRLKKLKILDLRYNEFEILLNSFGELEQLEDLRLLENKLNSFPDSFKGLTRLKYLDLGQNNFTNIPEAIENLTSLEVITVHGNQITSLSEDLCRCKNLQVMSIAKNPLTNLPENFGDLMLLNELNLHGTELSSLPESFGQLTKLTDLDLGENQLVSLPESFGQLTNLKELSLWGNQLRSLPESFGQLTKLQTLDLSSNKLSSLPESFGQLTSLEDLNLEQNQLRDFPKTFWNLKILKKFKWQNNPVDSEETQKKVEDSFSLLRERSKLSDLSFRAVQIGNFDVYIRDSLTKGPLLIFVVLFGAISKVWDDFFKFFSQKYRTVIYALDQQGKTGAPRQKALYQCDAYVKHLEDVIQSLGASQAKDRVTLIGYSFGGCVALDYALKHANQVERLVLISSVARFSHNFRDAGQYILEENSWEHPKKRLFDLNSQSDVATMFFGDKADPEIIRELKKLMQETPDYVLKAIVESIILKFDVISQLKDLSVPTLLLRGKQDDMICPKEAFDELKKIPIKNVVEIDQATHGVLFEGLQVLDQIQTFLNKDISRDN